MQLCADYIWGIQWDFAKAQFSASQIKIIVIDLSHSYPWDCQNIAIIIQTSIGESGTSTIIHESLRENVELTLTLKLQF